MRASLFKAGAENSFIEAVNAAYDVVDVREMKFEAGGRGSRFDSEATVMAFEVAMFLYSKSGNSGTGSEATKFEITLVKESA